MAGATAENHQKREYFTQMTKRESNTAGRRVENVQQPTRHPPAHKVRGRFPGDGFMLRLPHVWASARLRERQASGAHAYSNGKLPVDVIQHPVEDFRIRILPCPAHRGISWTGVTMPRQVAHVLTGIALCRWGSNNTTCAGSKRRQVRGGASQEGVSGLKWCRAERGETKCQRRRACARGTNGKSGGWLIPCARKASVRRPLTMRGKAATHNKQQGESRAAAFPLVR